jgi:hypothetical protein
MLWPFGIFCCLLAYFTKKNLATRVVTYANITLRSTTRADFHFEYGESYEETILSDTTEVALEEW